MEYTLPYITLILLLVLPLSRAITSEDDKSTMDALMAAINPTPYGWSSSTGFCQWSGVRCNEKGRVISIDLASKSLSGTLPPSLNSLSHLTALFLQNNFSGPFPSLANLSCLKHIYLQNNTFSSIRVGTFAGLMSLQMLSFSNNMNLSPWPFPSELVNSTRLVVLHANNANIMGPIPDIFQSFHKLAILSLSFNNMTGSLPSSFNHSAIQNLKLNNQKLGLSGSIDILCGMSRLSILWLHGNNFTGAISPCFISLAAMLLDVKLQNNDFEGPSLNFSKKLTADQGIESNSFCGNGASHCIPHVYMRSDVSDVSAPSGAKAKGGNGQKVASVVGLSLVLLVFIVAIPIGVYLCRKRDAQILSREVVEQQERYMKKKPQVILQKVDEKQEKVIEKKERNIKKREEVAEHEERHRMKSQEVEEQRERYMKEKPKISTEAAEQRDNSESLPLFLKRYTYKEMKSITNDFDEQKKIGEGGFADVYKGSLTDGTIVAVKRLNRRLGGNIDDFKNEVKALSSTRHYNLVNLLGYCAEDTHRILMYEYMSNGSLDAWIFSTDPKRYLSWADRKKIIKGITKGLVYLHENCGTKIVHRDVKPQNVLLDAKMNAKLCDFGLAKQLHRDQSSTSTIMAGTLGYMAPELMQGEKITEKVDVYSYGVVVLKIVFGNTHNDLVKLVQEKVRVKRLSDLTKNLNEDMLSNADLIKKIVRLAAWCLQKEPDTRPSMSDILADINRLEMKSPAKGNRS